MANYLSLNRKKPVRLNPKSEKAKILYHSSNQYSVYSKIESGVHPSIVGAKSQKMKEPTATIKKVFCLSFILEFNNETD